MEDTVLGILTGRGSAAPEDRRLARAYSSNPDIAALQAPAAAAAPAPSAPAVGSPPDTSSGAPNMAAAAAAAIAAAVSAVAGGGSPRRTDLAGDAAAAEAGEDGGGETASSAAASGAPSVPRPPGLSAEERSRRVLLCREKLEFLCSVEESPGMPWPRAKFQVQRVIIPCCWHAIAGCATREHHECSGGFQRHAQ